MQILVPVLPLLLCDFEEDTSLSGLSLHPGDVRDLDNELPCPAEHSVCPQGPVLPAVEYLCSPPGLVTGPGSVPKQCFWPEL